MTKALTAPPLELCHKDVKSKIKSSFLNFLKIVFAFGLIAWLIKGGRLNLRELKMLLTPENVMICMSLVGVTLYLASERWRVIMASQGFHLSRWMTFRLTFVGLFFNFFVPGGVGGDVVKAYYVARTNTERKFLSVFTILLDRVLGLFAMSVMAVASLALDFAFIWNHPQLHVVAVVLILLMTGFTVGGAIAFSRRFRHSRRLNKIMRNIPGHHRIHQLWDSLLLFRHHKIAFAKAFALSIVGQVCSVFVFIQCGTLLGYHLPLHLYFVAVPIGFMITAIPISPAGIGVGQAAFLFLFNAFQGTESNLGATAITAFQACSLLWGLVGAFFYMTMRAGQLSGTQPQTTLSP